MGKFFSKLFGSDRVDLWRRFERLQESTSGTMSTFYKVRDTQTGAVAGLKLIDRRKQDPVEARYKGLGKPSEGEIGMAISSANTVRTLEYGVSTADEPFILTEFLEGRVLHGLIAGGKPFAPKRRIELVRQAATAINVVHTSGFVHRDICPRNFMVTPDKRLVLFDFGLAVPDKPVFMQPGNRVGTPNYMAPEVVRRKQADKRLDMFSFGVTAYEICTLHSPWPRGTSAQAALAHDSPPVDIRSHWPEIPPDLAESIMACLAAQPSKRPLTMDVFLRLVAGVKA